MRKIKVLSFLMAALFVLTALVACGGDDTTTTGAATTTEDNKPVVYQPVDEADAITHKDFTSVYDTIGTKVTIDMVKEDAKGVATVTVDGKTYTLGLDFLSMAMVYNVTVPENHAKFKTADDVYNEWWKLYIQRWNMLVPEIPLYSNQYFDLYNAKINNFVTTPYWGPADAIISATIEGANTNVILGSSTDLSGAFRSSSWGKSSPGSADLDIENLTSGHATVQSNKEGALEWNMNALAAVPTSTVNEDGTLTYTIKIKEGLKFSDGSAIVAKNYIASILANSTAVSEAAGGSGKSGLQLVGFEAFNAYTGEGNTVYFDGVKLLDDYTFSVTFTADYAGYYYAMYYASYGPTPLALYLGDGDVVVNETTKACGLNDAFYAKEEKEGKQVYVTAEKIVANLKWNSDLPYSGPYVVSNYDEATKTATLTLNPNYTEDVRGKATINTISYVKIVSETQMDQFTTGKVDVLAGITGGTDTKNALKIVSESNGKFKETHYDRAGYGKLGFRCDFGPTGMTEVRQAIMYTINRPEFANTFTGGYGAVVDGPYYTGSAAYKANASTIKLNKYAYSVDKAIEVLEAAGWTYNVEGKTFNPEKDAVRYKKLSGYELSKENIKFKSTDGKYETVKIDGSYYMPLAINWYGTQPNDVTDQLVTAWQANPNATTKIGMYITYTECDFNGGLYGELFRVEAYGYNGVPKLNAVNFATGFNSAIYDQSWYFTINPELYDDYSNNFIMDEADFLENYAG